MLVQQQMISPLGCLALVVLVILLMPVLLVLVAGFVIYVLICRLFGVQRRPMGWQNYYRNFRGNANTAPRQGGQRPAESRTAPPFRGGTPPPASEDIIDVEVIEVEDHSEMKRLHKE